MGNQQEFLESGGFGQYLYNNHPDYEVVDINGIRGKVIGHINDPNYEHYSLPTYSNTSDMYFKEKEGEIVQSRLYTGRKMVLDFDWGHAHTNTTNGQKFKKGTVHVQEYGIDSHGKPVRHSDNARLMTDDEVEKYGPLIHAFNPKVKFR